MLLSFRHQVRRQFAAVQQSIRISGLKELAMNTFSRNLSLSLALLGGAAMAPQVLADDGYALAFEPSAARSSVQMETLHANILEVAKDYCQPIRRRALLEWLMPVYVKSLEIWCPK